MLKHCTCKASACWHRQQLLSCRAWRLSALITVHLMAPQRGTPAQLCSVSCTMLCLCLVYMPLIMISLDAIVRTIIFEKHSRGGEGWRWMSGERDDGTWKKQVGLKYKRMWCEMNYFQNKVLSVAWLYGHFLYCLVSAAWASWVQSSTACARESLRLFMKYLSSLWGDMRKVTWKVKRTKQKRRLQHCQNDKYSY